MATIILDFEVFNIPKEIDVPNRYTHALVLVRLKGKPIGQLRVPVLHGRVSGLALSERFMHYYDMTIFEPLIYDYLGLNDQLRNATLPSATVAVCTRDRPQDLQRCLEALNKLPDDGQEILVVDSCSATELTRQVTESYPRFRYIREPRPGLNIARNRALQEAQTDIVAFCDDDAVPDQAWLRHLLPNFHDPMVLGVTGLTMPLELETKAQEWFERHTPFGKGFQRKTFHGASCDPFIAGQVGAGANQALRKSVLEKVGLYDEALDAGTPTRSGGDHDMFCRILAKGYTIVYDPGALSWHRHKPEWALFRKTVFGYGVGVYASLTRSFLVEREWGALRAGWRWFRNTQFPALIRSLTRRPNCTPLDILIAELWGCIVGPWIYFYSRLKASRIRKQYEHQ